VTNITDPTELKTVLKDHIDAVLGRYANDLYAFDVINERKSSPLPMQMATDLYQHSMRMVPSNHLFGTTFWERTT
jgi:GH35 family endo-1,4-beta-xylanase